MRRLARLVAAAALALASVNASPALASPRPKTGVEWTKVEVPRRDDAAVLERTLRKLLGDAAKKAKLGHRDHVALRAKVVELRTEQHGDVLRVRCTLAGKIEGGPGATSRISFGGSPADRAKLEKQVLTMVANGLVARLAEIVRSR